MKKHFIKLLFVVLPFLCNAQQTIEATITHDGQERAYILYVPAAYDPSIATPLVLCYHGYTSSASTIMAYSGFNAIADTANFIIAYPQGTLLNGVTHWNVGGWTTASTTDDVGFTNALLDTIAAEYTIDNTKIYATGMSNGGFMSFLLACQLSDKIAAIASVTGSMTPETYSACDPQHPMPVMQIHGTSDGTVPYNGAVWTKSINAVVNYWVAFNHTNTTATTSSIENTSTTDGSTVESITYAAGDSCSSVVHYKVTGGDHTWPGAWGNMDIKASALVWDFLSQYGINGKASCEQGGEEGGNNEEEEEEETDPILTPNKKAVEQGLSVYPNPTNAFITVANDYLVEANYVVCSLNGIVVLKGHLIANNKRIGISKLKAGVYLLKIGEETVKFMKED